MTPLQFAAKIGARGGVCNRVVLTSATRPRVVLVGRIQHFAARLVRQRTLAVTDARVFLRHRPFVIRHSWGPSSSVAVQFSRHLSVAVSPALERLRSEIHQREVHRREVHHRDRHQREVHQREVHQRAILLREIRSNVATLIRALPDSAMVGTPWRQSTAVRPDRLGVSSIAPAVVVPPRLTLRVAGTQVSRVLVHRGLLPARAAAALSTGARNVERTHELHTRERLQSRISTLTHVERTIERSHPSPVSATVDVVARAVLPERARARSGSTAPTPTFVLPSLSAPSNGSMPTRPLMPRSRASESMMRVSSAPHEARRQARIIGEPIAVATRPTAMLPRFSRRIAVPPRPTGPQALAPTPTANALAVMARPRATRTLTAGTTAARAHAPGLEYLRPKTPAPASTEVHETLRRQVEEQVERKIVERVEAVVARELAPDSIYNRRLSERICAEIYDGLVLERERMGWG